MAKNNDTSKAAADQKTVDTTSPESSNPPAPELGCGITPGYRVNSPVQHDGVRYEPGSVLEKITGAQAKLLLDRKIITVITE